MIAVTGASGQLGRLVLIALSERVAPADIVAVVRNPDSVADLAAQGVQVRRGDYTDAPSLAAAFDGVETVLLISSNDIGNRVPQHAAVIEAAEAAGVGHLVYTSVLHAEDLGIGLSFEHPPTETALKESGLAHTILRNGWYTENYVDGINGALATGILAGATADGRISAAARKDYAEAAAIVLADPSPHSGKTYELAGDAGFSLAELAELIAATAGKPINHADMPQAAYEKLLLDLGLPAPFAAALAEADTAIASGKLEETGRTLSGLIGRPTTPISELVERLAAA